MFGQSTGPCASPPQTTIKYRHTYSYQTPDPHPPPGLRVLGAQEALRKVAVVPADPLRGPFKKPPRLLHQQRQASHV